MLTSMNIHRTKISVVKLNEEQLKKAFEIPAYPLLAVHKGTEMILY